MKDTLIPDLAEWRDVWSANRAAAKELQSRLNDVNIEAVRKETFAAAREYTAEVIALGTEVGVKLDMPSIPPLSEGVVAAGHQPVIYHPGLLFKNESLSSFARTVGAASINVIVDTDEGDGGKLVYPDQGNGDPVLRQHSISSAPGALFMTQRVAEKERVASVFEYVKEGFRSVGIPVAEQCACAARDLYERLAGADLARANTVVRWSKEKASYLELPLSRLMKLPSVDVAVRLFLNNSERVHTIYNETLTAFRAERRIKNPANPFPNMKRESRGFELPFWVIDPSKGERRPLLSDGTSLNSTAGETLAPRGSIVTLLLRGLVSDIFIHGLGGAKYDPYVDEFAKALFGLTLPRFVVASRTRHLFSEAVERYETAVALKTRYKEIVSHTEQYLDPKYFTSPEIAELKAMIEPRSTLLEKLRSAQSAAERSEVAHQLNALNRDLKGYLDSSSLSSAMKLANTDEPTVEAWKCREFPLFIFGNA